LVHFPNCLCLRDFIYSAYTDLKKLNPDLPILVRERSGTEAMVWARYGENALLYCFLPPPPPLPFSPLVAPGTVRRCFLCVQDFGVEKSICVDGMSKADVEAQIKNLVDNREALPR